MKENNNKINFPFKISWVFLRASFSEVLNILEKESIQYCILRAIEKKWQDSPDIDICINKNSIENAILILEDMIENENAVIIFNKNTAISHQHIFIMFIDNNCTSKILKFDFQSDFYINGILFFDSEYILQNIEKKAAFNSIF